MTENNREKLLSSELPTRNCSTHELAIDKNIFRQLLSTKKPGLHSVSILLLFIWLLMIEVIKLPFLCIHQNFEWWPKISLMHSLDARTQLKNMIKCFQYLKIARSELQRKGMQEMVLEFRSFYAKIDQLLKDFLACQKVYAYPWQFY